MKIPVGTIKPKVQLDILRLAIGLDPIREMPEGKEWVDTPLTETERQEALDDHPVLGTIKPEVNGNHMGSYEVTEN